MFGDLDSQFLNQIDKLKTPSQEFGYVNQQTYNLIKKKF